MTMFEFFITPAVLWLRACAWLARRSFVLEFTRGVTILQRLETARTYVAGLEDCIVKMAANIETIEGEGKPVRAMSEYDYQGVSSLAARISAARAAANNKGDE